MKIAVIAALAASFPLLAPAPPARAAIDPSLTPAEVRAIAKEAYVYGFPLVDDYRVLHAYFVDPTSPEYKGPWNTVHGTPRVYTPADKAVQTPNSDTPYSMLGFDLRTEPIVLSIPPIAGDRYFSVQLIDADLFNFAYLGSRTTGNGGGEFLLAGPGWKGEKPPGIREVFRSGTDLGLAIYRTQLFSPADLEEVKKIQGGYRVRPLSEFLGTKPPPAAPPLAFPKPLSAEAQRTDPRFFELLDFTLGLGPIVPEEQETMKRFARIGVGPGLSFDAGSLSPEMRAAVEGGMADAWAAFAEFKKSQVDTGRVTSGDVFGTREFIHGDWMRRMAGAVIGIYGNSREEAMYPVYFTDATGAKLDGAKDRYTLRFPPGQLPPVDAFWSLTMYELPSSLLSENPIHRYLVNSPMLPSLKRDPDGGITLRIQHDSPGAALESNWLPAPAGPFWMALRLYRPKADALDGRWKQPPVEVAGPVPAAGESGKAPPAPDGEGKSAAAATQVGAPDGSAATAATSREPSGGVTVTPETYVRAESDRSFGNIAKLAGGVNRFYKIRTPTPLDRQTIVRMNKDTLYSAAIVDTEGGATITIPEVPKGRYASVLLIDNDHYCPGVIYGAGTHELPRDTKYLAVAVRVQLLDPANPADVAAANAIQDGFEIHAKSADPFPPSKWDAESLTALTRRYEKESAAFPNWNGMMGPRGHVNEKDRHVAAAAAWGLFPERDAIYLNFPGGKDAKTCHEATYVVPEHGAFWSITVYGSDGYMKSPNAIVNSSNVKTNPDGTFTVRFGSEEACGDVPNRIDVTDGWNFLMRIYRPGPSVQRGEYVLPDPKPVARATGAS